MKDDISLLFAHLRAEIKTISDPAMRKRFRETAAILATAVAELEKDSQLKDEAIAFYKKTIAVQEGIIAEYEANLGDPGAPQGSAARGRLTRKGRPPKTPKR